MRIALTALALLAAAFATPGCGFNRADQKHGPKPADQFEVHDRVCRGLHLPEDPEAYYRCREDGCKMYPAAKQCSKGLTDRELRRWRAHKARGDAWS